MSDSESDAGRHAVTQLLREAAGGRAQAFEQLLPLVYDQLKELARGKMRAQREGHTLTPTALVHEAYLKLVDHAELEWQSRAHFFAVASNAMRQILIDYAKMKNAGKRGGGAAHVSFDAVAELTLIDGSLTDEQADWLVGLDDALNALAEFDKRGALVVQYRFFGGLRHREIADVLGTSEVTVRRAWTAAKIWLRRELREAHTG